MRPGRKAIAEPPKVRIAEIIALSGGAARRSWAASSAVSGLEDFDLLGGAVRRRCLFSPLEGLTHAVERRRERHARTGEVEPREPDAAGPESLAVVQRDPRPVE